MLTEESSKVFDYPICKEENIQFQQKLEGSIANKSISSRNISKTGVVGIFYFYSPSYWLFFGAFSVLEIS